MEFRSKLSECFGSTAVNLRHNNFVWNDDYFDRWQQFPNSVNWNARHSTRIIIYPISDISQENWRSADYIRPSFFLLLPPPPGKEMRKHCHFLPSDHESVAAAATVVVVCRSLFLLLLFRSWICGEGRLMMHPSAITEKKNKELGRSCHQQQTRRHAAADRHAILLSIWSCCHWLFSQW